METTNNSTLETVMGTVAEPQQNNEPANLTLADVIGGGEGEGVQADAQPTNDTVPTQEPGWFQGRLQKERAKWEAAHQDEMNQLRAQVDEFREYRLGEEADKLVASGKITDREMALDYLRSKHGLPAAETSRPVERDERGRFVSNKPTNEVQQKADALIAQANTLKRSAGFDAIALFNSDPEVKQKVLSGEWDFVDAYEATKQNQRRPAPSPVRGSNSMGIGSIDVRTLTDAQFEKLNSMLENGGSIDMRS